MRITLLCPSALQSKIKWTSEDLTTFLLLDFAYYPSQFCGIVLIPIYDVQTVTNADCDLVFSNELNTILELQINATQITSTSFLTVSALWNL